VLPERILQISATEVTTMPKQPASGETNDTSGASPGAEPKPGPGGGDSIVKKGGIGTDADAEDVSRDTYGFTGSENVEGEMSPEEARERLDEILPLDDKRD
jgi:hypothetical protein